MSKPNGRQKRAIENLATALNECFDASAERAAETAAERAADRAAGGAAEAAERVAERAADRAAESVKAELKADMNAMERRLNKRMDTRLDKQDDTLRMIWTQCAAGARRANVCPSTADEESQNHASRFAAPNCVVAS